MKKNILLVGDEKFSNEVSKIVHALDMGVAGALSGRLIKKLSRRPDVAAVVFDDSQHIKYIRLLLGMMGENVSSKPWIIVSAYSSPLRVIEAQLLGAKDYIVKPYNSREFIARLNALVHRKKRITCIGGGTGLFQVLVGLKDMPGTFITSVVNMSDDGGSSGRLRAEFGILPPGDVRRSLVALSNAPEMLSNIMNYRFKDGGCFVGHNLGNLLLTALIDMTGSTAQAIKEIGNILRVQGNVLPVTVDKTTLCARFADDTIVEGESRIDLCEDRGFDIAVKEIWHNPETSCNIEAFSAVINTDIVIIGPGDLYTSVLTNLLVRNLNEAIRCTSAKKIYICNLMTKPGETHGYSALRHVEEVISYLGGDYLDYIVLSNTVLPKKALDSYAQQKQYPVVNEKPAAFARITKAKVLYRDIANIHDIVRHDSDKLAKIVREIIQM